MRVFQISKFKQPQYIIDNIKLKCPGYEYFNFIDSDIDLFFKNTILPSELGSISKDLFKYIYLYLYGGIYITPSILLHEQIDEIIKEYEFVSIKSALNNNSIFNGFIAVKPKIKLFSVLSMISVQSIR